MLANLSPTLPQQEREEYLAGGVKLKFTDATPTDVASLQKRIEVIRARGYETDVGGVFEDVASVSFPRIQFINHPCLDAEPQAVL